MDNPSLPEQPQPSAIIQDVPTSNPPTQNPRSKAFLPLLVVLALIISTIAGVAGYYIGVGKSETQSVTNQISEVNTDVNDDTTDSENIEQETHEDSIRKMDLSTIITTKCSNYKLSAEDVPLIFTDNLKNKYQLQNGFSCDVDEKYAYAELRNAQGNFPLSTLHVFNDQSQYFGESNPFFALRSVPQVEINGKHYYLNVMEPGPYGISDLGIWVEIINDKQFPNWNATVRSTAMIIVDNTETDQFVASYPNAYKVVSDLPDEPTYTISTQDSAQFEKDFAAFVQNENSESYKEIQKIIHYVDEDMNGITLK